MNDVSTLEHLRTLMDERDCRYKQRFEAQEEAVKLALKKAEGSQANMISWAGLLIAVISVVISVLR